MAVRYSIVSVLFLIVIVYFLGGYLHARQRLRKGLQPMAYHRWMVRRQMYYAAAHPYARNQQQHGAPPAHGYYAYGGTLPQHAYPPPAYNADQPPPPVYAAGQDGGKTAVDQRYGDPVRREGEGSSVGAPPSAPQPAGQLGQYQAS